MKQLLSSRLIALGIVLGAIGAATMLVTTAQAKVSSKLRIRDTATVVARNRHDPRRLARAHPLPVREGSQPRQHVQYGLRFVLAGAY
jgi:hypothetical protein